jgi:epoxide hydrolase-like predicted phosphatase
MIKAIIFDAGGVLLEGKVEDVYKALSEELNIDFKELMRMRAKHIGSLRTGKMSARRFSRFAEMKFHLKGGFYKKWKKVCLEEMPVNKETLEIAKKLSKNYRTAVISNTNSLYVEINSERKLYTTFEFAINSCEERCMKPQKEIFRKALEKLGLEAEECIYIDDNMEILETPKEMGFRTIWFKNSRQLAHELKELGIIF